MASTINADDGVVSGSAGVKTSADNSGVLELQSNGTTQFTLGSSSVVINEAGADVDFRVEGDTDANLLFVDASTDRVGVGTNTPLAKVQANAQINTTYSSSNTLAGGVIAYVKNTSTTSSTDATIRLEPTTAGSIPACSISAVHTGSDGASALTFGTRASGSSDVTEKARIDPSGNLGLGGTPSNWQSGRTVLQITPSSTQGHLAFGGVISNISTNAFVDATDARWEYIGNGIPTLYQQDEGRHFWYTAASGTANSEITWGDPKMTLDASGDLGVGTTSPNVGGWGKAITLQGASNAAYEVTEGTVRAAYYAVGASYCGIGTETNHPFIFTTNATERARITSGGDLYLGKTASNINNVGWELDDNGNGSAVFTMAATNEIFVWNNTSTSGTAIIDFRTNAVSKGRISWDNTSTTYATSSDRRLKENIAPADDAGTVIDAIEIVKHDWKVGGHTRYGAIAQDLYDVAPEAVSVGDDGEEVERAWSVDYSKLVPMLVKEIQCLRQRVAELEAK